MECFISATIFLLTVANFGAEMPSILARLLCLLHIGLKPRPAKHAYDLHVNTKLASRSGSCNHCDAKQTHLKPVAVQHPVQVFIT